MTTLDLNAYGVTEMSHAEKVEENGGFVPLVVLGLSLSAKAVAGAMGACFLTGVAVGAAVAANS